MLKHLVKKVAVVVAPPVSRTAQPVEPAQAMQPAVEPVSSAVQTAQTVQPVETVLSPAQTVQTVQPVELSPVQTAAPSPVPWLPRRPPRLWVHIYLHKRHQDFDFVPMLIGKGGRNMRAIFTATSAKVRIRGRGSGHCELSQNGRPREAPVPLMLAITADMAGETSFLKAVDMAIEQLQIITTLYKQFCDQRSLPQPTRKEPCFSFCEIALFCRHMMHDLLKLYPHPGGPKMMLKEMTPGGFAPREEEEYNPEGLEQPEATRKNSRWLHGKQDKRAHQKDDSAQTEQQEEQQMMADDTGANDVLANEMYWIELEVQLARIGSWGPFSGNDVWWPATGSNEGFLPVPFSGNDVWLPATGSNEGVLPVPSPGDGLPVPSPVQPDAQVYRTVQIDYKAKGELASGELCLQRGDTIRVGMAKSGWVHVVRVSMGQSKGWVPEWLLESPYSELN